MTIALFTVIDLETTGLEPPAEVIEIGWTRLHLDTETRAVEISPPQARLFSPSAPLTPENIAVHHLTDAMLAGFERCTDDDLATIACSESAFEALKQECLDCLSAKAPRRTLSEWAKRRDAAALTETERADLDKIEGNVRAKLSK
jgi:hypothetical protein